MDPVLRGISGGTAGQNQVITWFERCDGKTRLFESRRIGPFGGKHLRVPVLVDAGQVEKGVRIDELEGDDITFDGDLLLLEIFRSKRMMRRRRGNGRQRCERHRKQDSLHAFILMPRDVGPRAGQSAS